MSKPTLTIMQLYPDDMNIYGDWGNTLTILRRCTWHGITPKLVNYNQGDSFEKPDIIIGGGGQDSGQFKIQEDLMNRKDILTQLAESNTPMLLVCGLYQLFGNFFKTKDGQTLEGLGIFDMETHGGNERLTGNIVTESLKFGEIVGYENHSGQTFLGKTAKPLGQIIRGGGNNGHDDTEGAMYKNVIGTYMHGSLLPKNPGVADFLIEQAMIKQYGEFTPNVPDDSFALKARAVAKNRPR